MSPQTINEWERVEIERSAAEASHIDAAHLIVGENQILRYLNPPADTSYPLEYSYYLLGDVRGKTVLEYGCGDGLDTIVLAQRGAKVKALDISHELISFARQRLTVNDVSADAEFVVGSAHELPFADDSVDVVFGMAILHHLDLAVSAQEVRRVLRPGGRAIFREPVRNSSFIKFIRGLIPYQAGDISPFERPLTDKELAIYAKDFSSYRSKAFVLPTTSLMEILTPQREQLVHNCYRTDSVMLQRLPFLTYYATQRVIELVK